MLWGLLKITNYISISEYSYANYFLCERLSSILLYYKISTPNGFFAWMFLNLYILLVWYFGKDHLIEKKHFKDIYIYIFNDLLFLWNIYNCIIIAFRTFQIPHQEFKQIFFYLPLQDMCLISMKKILVFV